VLSEHRKVDDRKCMCWFWSVTHYSLTLNLALRYFIFTTTETKTVVRYVVSFSAVRYLTFIGPCIAIYSYSTTNKMHLFLKLFILVKRSTCFGRSVRPSSGAQNCTYINGICQTAAATCCYREWDGTGSKLRIQQWYMSDSCCYLLLFDIYRCCIPSFELLMMSGKTVRNM